MAPPPILHRQGGRSRVVADADPTGVVGLGPLTDRLGEPSPISSITRVNQAWAMDITYIPMARGFV